MTHTNATLSRKYVSIKPMCHSKQILKEGEGIYLVWCIYVNLFKSIFSKNDFLCNDDKMVWLMLRYTTLQYTTIQYAVIKYMIR